MSFPCDYFGYGQGGYGQGGYGEGAGFQQYYLNLITSQYQGSPKFMAMLAVYLQPLADIMSVMCGFNDDFDVYQAVGAQLDTIGTLVGAGRMLPFTPTGGYSAVLSDSDYRTLLLATIAQNTWDGQASSLWNIWNTLFPGGSIYVIDNQDMTATIILAGNFSAVAQQMITNGLIVPRPETVQYTYEFATLPLFGFDGANPTIVAGFDIGHWG